MLLVRFCQRGVPHGCLVRRACGGSAGGAHSCPRPSASGRGEDLFGVVCTCMWSCGWCGPGSSLSCGRLWHAPCQCLPVHQPPAWETSWAAKPTRKLQHAPQHGMDFKVAKPARPEGEPFSPSPRVSLLLCGAPGSSFHSHQPRPRAFGIIRLVWGMTPPAHPGVSWGFGAQFVFKPS